MVDQTFLDFFGFMPKTQTFDFDFTDRVTTGSQATQTE